MSTNSNLWTRFARSKKYREEFVAAQVKRGIPFQARVLLKDRQGWTQETLAEKAGLSQGVISRALNPTYGNLTLNTIIRIAAGFDVAFIGRFVPFSELKDWFLELSEESQKVQSFAEENDALTKMSKVPAMDGSQKRQELGRPGLSKGSNVSPWADAYPSIKQPTGAADMAVNA